MAKEVQKAQAGGMVVPDFMKQDAGLGAENIGANDVSVPLLKLMQGLSPEVEEGRATIGEFFHVLADMPLGKTLVVTPLMIRKRAVLWRPRWDGGGILARSHDMKEWDVHGRWEVKPTKESKSTITWANVDSEGRPLSVDKSGLMDWGSSNPADADSPPAASLTYDIALFLHEHADLGPVVLSLSRTGVRPAQDFQGKLKLASTRFPIFGLKFNLSSWTQTADDDKFQNVKFSADGVIQDGEVYADCKNLYEHFKSMNVVVQDVHPDESMSGSEGETAF